MAEDGHKPYAVVVLSKDDTRLDIILERYTNKKQLRSGYLKYFDHAIQKNLLRPVPVKRVNGQGFKVLTDLVTSDIILNKLQAYQGLIV